MASERFDQVFQSEFTFLEGGFELLLVRGGMRNRGVVLDLLVERVVLDAQLMEILSFSHAHLLTQKRQPTTAR